jgi:acetolactate synthase-1/2/3 large subunit
VATKRSEENSGAVLPAPDIFCKTLLELGVQVVFGLPGTQNEKLFEALGRLGPEVVVPTHELAASFMANGYARASGRPGVLLTISGPGFTYALSGIAEAALDSVALLHIAVSLSRMPGRKFQLQALEQESIAAPLVKRVFRVSEAEDLRATLTEAYSYAREGEPGPVLLEIETKLLADELPWADTSEAAEISPSHDRSSPTGSTGDAPAPEAARENGFAAAVRGTASRLRSSKKVLLLLGQGAAGAAEEVRVLAETQRAVVLTTTSGRGVLPEDHPLSLGFEYSGTRAQARNAVLAQADLVLAVGCKFSHNSSHGFRLEIPAEKLIQVDTGLEVLGANYPASLTLQADARAFLGALLEEHDGDAPSGRGWSTEEVDKWRKRGLESSWLDLPEPSILGHRPQRFFTALRNVMPRDGLLVADSGLHQLLARRYYQVFCPHGLLIPTDFQSMGYALPAALGAKAARPDQTVGVLVGDGGMSMSGLELLTAGKTKRQLCVMVINDGSYGLIRRSLESAHGNAYGTQLLNPDFEDLAKATHANYLRLNRNVQASLRRAFQLPGVTLVEVPTTDSTEMILAKAKGMVKRAAGRRVMQRLKELLGRDES